MKKVAILGSTGSIGENTLRVIADNRDRFEVVALAAGSNWERLAHQAREFSPKLVSISNSENVASLNNGTDVKVLSGSEGLREVAAGVGADIVVSALVGAVGLEPTLAAIEAGAAIALANKETLVVAGELITKLAQQKGVNIYPVDSEHSAIFQCLTGGLVFVKDFICLFHDCRLNIKFLHQ